MKGHKLLWNNEICRKPRMVLWNQAGLVHAYNEVVNKTHQEGK
jgi:hypothetical protein